MEDTVTNEARGWKRLTPDDADHFFGYYDRNPWNHDQTLHLALRVAQCVRLPAPGETADIGVVPPEGGFTPLVTTRAWCPQQGSMELFLPRRPGCFVYNDFDVDEGRLVARVFDMGKGPAGRYERPIYGMTPDGRHAASLDFARIPRRGYSYADAALPQTFQPERPAEEGLWLMDLDDGTSRLLASYATMIARHPYAYGLRDRYLWLNHAIFNRDGSRVLWLLRACDDPADPGKGWQTFMYTCGLDGTDVECVLPEVFWKGQISHQIWGRGPREILVDACWAGRGHEAVVFDESRKPFLARSLSPSHGYAAHMVFSPDGRWILADSYPHEDGTQYLYRIDAADGSVELLGRFRHRQPPGTAPDMRCDLHPRWSPDGRRITVDSLDGGRRAVYSLTL